MKDLGSSSVVYNFAGVLDITSKLGVKQSTKTWGQVRSVGQQEFGKLRKQSLKLGTSQERWATRIRKVAEAVTETWCKSGALGNKNSKSCGSSHWNLV